MCEHDTILAPPEPEICKKKSEMKFDVDWEANEKVSIAKQAKICMKGLIGKLEWK
jgi:hypothetical protein